ncbi:MAG: TIM barrel protein [Bacteroidetes bacterium]|nr:TIM barrel protein [Bacteroidota bacterium]
MKTNLAIAPCSWGVEDASNKNNPSWMTVLDEASKGGFRGIELGPYGYLPQDPVMLKDELDSRGLTLVAGTLYDDLLSSSNVSDLLEKTHTTCRLLSSIIEVGQKACLVIIDKVKNERNHTAGQSEKALRLGPEDWAVMMNHIQIIAQIADGEYGIRPVVHPHAGGFIEFDDEIEHYLQDIPDEKAGLCLDTGHLYYAGDDPAQSIRKYFQRLDYLHFKDINKDRYHKAIYKNQGFFDACLDGVMCSIGRGCVDYRTIKESLNQLGYQGWITIEQERDPLDSAGVFQDITESLDFLIRKGFEK